MFNFKKWTNISNKEFIIRITESHISQQRKYKLKAYIISLNIKLTIFFTKHGNLQC